MKENSLEASKKVGGSSLGLITQLLKDNGKMVRLMA
jgi:hypothetical protein